MDKRLSCGSCPRTPEMPECAGCHKRDRLGKSLGEIMGPELVAAIQRPGMEDIVGAWARETLRHHDNPLYKHAADYWLKTQAAQIQKGAGKYPKPLLPETYTFEELADHAMEENIDQAHYITAMREKAEGMRKRLELGAVAERVLAHILDGAGTGQRTNDDIARVAVRGAAEYFHKKNIMEVE